MLSDFIKNLWKYASTYELFQIVFTTILGNIVVITYMFLIQQPLPRGIYAIVILLDMALIGGVRFSFRVYKTYGIERNRRRRKE